LEIRNSRKRPRPVRGSIRNDIRIQPCGKRISFSENCAASALSTASIISWEMFGKRVAPP
jgi:hypothetical protein